MKEPSVTEAGGVALKLLPAPEHGTFALRSDIRPDPNQPRTEFPPAAMADLRDSIDANGVQDPLLVRKDPEGKTKWMIIEGERRWRVAGELKLARLPVIVREMSEDAVRRYQRIVGTQRLNLSALEEARALEKELKRHQAADAKFSVSDLAKASGRARATTYELLSLLKLQAPVLKALQAGEITPSHATRIALLPSEDGQMSLLKDIRDDARYGDVPSVADLERTIAQNHCKSLKGAPFDLKNEKIFDGAQMVKGEWHIKGMKFEEIEFASCEKCPLRSGNLPNWPDAKNPQMCLRPSCYRAKVLVNASRNGQAVLSDTDYAKRSDEFYRMTECKSWGSKGYTHLSEAMGKHAPKPTVTVDSRGEVLEVVLKVEAKAAMEKNGVKFERPGASKVDKAKERAKQEEAEKLEELREQVVIAACPELLKKLDAMKDADAWKLAAKMCEADDTYTDDVLEDHLISKAKTPKGKVLARLFASSEWSPLGRNDWNADNVKVWKEVGVDLIALEKVEAAKAKATEKPKTGGGN